MGNIDWNAIAVFTTVFVNMAILIKLSTTLERRLTKLETLIEVILMRADILTPVKPNGAGSNPSLASLVNRD